MDFLTEYRKTVAAEIDAIVRECYGNIVDIAKQIVKHEEGFTYAVNCNDFREAAEHITTVSNLFERVAEAAVNTTCWNKLGKIIKEFKEPSFDSDVIKRTTAIYNATQPKQGTADDV